MKQPWQFPYPSARMPICADNMVATSQPLATQAGLRILRNGGNAVDAALATAITLTVVEPNNNGVGSDLFAQIWDGSTLHGYNGSGRSPAAWDQLRFAGREKMPLLGWDSVTVPGAVAGWRDLSQRFGRLPFKELFSDAIDYARHGFPVGPKTAFYWHYAGQQYEAFSEFQAHFLPHGRAPQAGERFRRADLATTLELIANTQAQAFYKGELADAIIQDSEQHGGAMSKADLAAHEGIWVQPLSAKFADTTLHEIPPNGQGIVALIGCALLEVLKAQGRLSFELAHKEPAQLHLVVEATRRAIFEGFRHICDPEYLPQASEALLESKRVTQWANQIDEASCFDFATETLRDVPVNPDTVYLASADNNGMMVSLIQSNYLAFGSGIVIPGTGISMQNRGAGFSLINGHPNQVSGGKRPYHTIIPGFVTQAGAPRMAFGVMGGHMQHQGHIQMMLRIFGAGENPQTASDAPRWHINENLDLIVETGFPDAHTESLRALGHKVEYGHQEHVFGGAQLIYRDMHSNSYIGASDHRKEGQAAGF